MTIQTSHLFGAQGTGRSSTQAGTLGSNVQSWKNCDAVWSKCCGLDGDLHPIGISICTEKLANKNRSKISKINSPMVQYIFSEISLLFIITGWSFPSWNRAITAAPKVWQVKKFGPKIKMAGIWGVHPPPKYHPCQETAGLFVGDDSGTMMVKYPLKKDLFPAIWGVRAPSNPSLPN